MLFEINKSLCEAYSGLDPIKLLDYAAEDVFDLINNVISYNNRNKKQSKNSTVIRRQAGDNWF
jgi:ribosome-associated toxin RatA of RatAB toxin-antitoxin module